MGLLGVLTVGALALAGCQGDAGDKGSEPNAGCDLISAESLAQITGGQDLFVTGGHIDQDERSYLSCDVLTTGSPTDLVRILAYDIGGEEARTNAEETRRGQQEAGPCEDITPLPGDDGYLCTRADRVQIDASVALEDRLVRFTFYEDAQLDEVTPENVRAWAKEVDDRVRELDDSR
ncbi:hypothetical protein GCM10009821_28240 [Aeromicrobium halocynthiae]|uniref:DUF3558 domain-containing protein n=1 Tax=Aeromicrobium halocynthiae TaxID=560557 RepID=A0ABN2W6K0_9ACTN